MEHEKLDKILSAHKRWLKGEGGERADMDKANLCYADLRCADMSYADLRCADMSKANLCYADLCYADLYSADLSCADMSHANLRYADLRCADLRNTDLYRANMHNARLTGTVLDPDAEPNGVVESFGRDGDYVIGYRTREAGHIDEYRDGRFYSADVFSVAETGCHPGLYLWPSVERAREWKGGAEIIKVRTKPSEVHRAGSKWRCRWFEVRGSVEAKTEDDTEKRQAGYIP